MKKKTRALALALAMCLGLTVPAFADASTTTMETVYKDRDARTEIYTVTDTPGSDYVYYGAKGEPQGGVYYGRTTLGGTLSNGYYGLVNESEMAGESAVSFYYGLSNDYSLEYWSYMYGPALEDGDRVFLVYLNFDHEGDDCPSVINGSYDSKLNETFDYINTLSCPVFVRIGGEMNVWSKQAAPEQFIGAFRHIADIARARAPQAIMVFSPSFSSGWKMDMDDYYPGDAYVDWVGTSLYYDHDHVSGLKSGGSDKDDAFYGIGVYGDPMLNVQQTVNLSRLHQKPVIITEGGSSNKCGGTDTSVWASERMAKAYSFLTMVYPEIKCMIASDYGYDWSPVYYTFYNNSVMTSAYRQAVSANPTYVRDYRDAGSYYTKLSAYAGDWAGTMRFASYTYSPDKQTATWSVDGQAQATVTEYPYTFDLDVDALGYGGHTLTVTFSNGATKSYTFQKAEPPIYASNGAQVSSWAKDQVDEAIAQALLADGLGTDYRVNITRGQFAATAVKLYEAMSGEKAPAAGDSPFSDTSDPVIIQAADLGFVSGVGGGRFAPDDLVTREQAASMLSRVYTKLGGEIPAVEATSFADNSSVSNWARDSVAFMADKEVISGVGGNAFNPLGQASIEQALSISLRMFKNLK